MLSETALSRSRLLALTLAPVAILAPAPLLQAQEPDEDAYLGEAPERYAQVKVLEGEARIRKGDVDEELGRGVPVAEGDVIESRGRGVLQLGDGSRIAFAGDTRFRILALFADREGDRQVLLALDRGRIRVQVGRDSDGRIRVDTPSGTGTLAEGDSVTFEVDSDRTTRVRVHAGRISFANSADRARLLAGERLTAYGDRDRLDRVRAFNTFDVDAFDGWAERYVVVRRSRSWERVPREIRYYSDDLDEHGEWVYADDVNDWVWRPLRVTVDWRPYWRGRWGAYAGGMTWISDDPWGNVTFHFGRWGWSSRWGWYWSPGIYYSPAWVAWNHYDSYFGWAPLGYWNTPVSWGYGPWGGGYCWNVVSFGHVHHHHLHRRIYTDVNVIRTFNRGTGATTWSTGGSASGRSLTAPWRRGPVVVRANELQNPNEFRRALSRDVVVNRVRDYERQAQTQTGRTILRRDLAQPRPEGHGAAAQPTGPGRDGRGASSSFRALEDRPRPSGERSVVREPGGRPLDRPHEDRPRPSGREEAPRTGSEDRGRTVEDRALPRERPRQDRPLGFEERPRPREERPSPREDRPAPREERPTPREDRPAPREERPMPREERPAPREERPAPRSERPSREDRPAPRMEAPSFSRPSAPSRSESPRSESPRSSGRPGR